MNIKKILRLRVLSIGFLVMAAIFFGQKVFALSFDLANHPGMCFKKVSISNHVANILLYPCATQNTYTLNDNTLTAIIIKAECNYTYNCGSCISGLKSCTVSSVVPSNYTCNNPPVTQQTCASPTPCTSYDYGSWSGCKTDGIQTRTVTASYPAGCDQNATGSAPVLLSNTCTVCDYNCTTWGACVGGIQSRTCSTSSATCVPPYDASTIPNTQQTCSTACTSYTYGAWGACVSGFQSRNLTSQSPAGCTDTSSAELTQTCSTACTSYTYGAWGACVSGFQSRNLTSQSPAGCTDTSSAELTQTCSTACTSYDYSIWGSCVSGTQVRTIVNKYPSGCNDADSAVLSQTCTNEGNIPCTGYTYYDWSGCKTTGKQERTIKSVSPENCILNSSLSEIPVLSQNCTVCVYTVGSWGNCSNGTKTRTVSGNPSGCVAPDDVSTIPSNQMTCTADTGSGTNCTYTYGSWSACGADGKQTRSIYKLPSGCVEDPANPPAATEQSCTPSSTACTYQCAGWGGCSSAGVRSRTCTATPAGCVAKTAAPATQESCPACAYTYGEWKACAKEGKQTRDFKQSPDACYQKEKPIIEKSCTYAAPACSYSYSGWSACDANGIQTRTYTKTPEGCTESAANAAVVKQTCVPGTQGTCTYSYGEWSACGANGKQTRTVVSKTPSGCKEGVPLLEQNCEIKNKPVDDDKFVPSCEYAYSSWGACVGGSENRMVVSKQPKECKETLKPELKRACQTVAPAKERPSDAPDPEPLSVLETETPEVRDFNGKTSKDWQKYYFGSESCRQSELCGGLADPDNDGLVNNEEYRFGTDPKDSDTDNDGHVDGEEIETGNDPLVKPDEEKSDKIIFENPKETGEVKEDLLEVANVETVETADENKGLKISGKALPDTYITIYIYSEPIVLTVKTDSEGNWSYILEDPVDEGTHEVYVAVTDNTGKITAKSSPLTFVQTAEAASVVPTNATAEDRVAAPGKARLTESYLIFGAAGLGGLLLALAAIGMLKGKGSNN